jgi:hypothetical protein
MNDTGYEAVAAEQAVAFNNGWDPAEGIWNMVLSTLLQQGQDVEDAVRAADTAVSAHRKLFKGNY